LKLHPDGELINVIGQLSLPTSGPIGERLRHDLDRWRGRTRLLVRLPLVDPGKDQLDVPLDAQREVNLMIQRLGLRADFSDCLRVKVMTPAAFGGGERPLVPSILGSCRVVEREDGRGAGYDAALVQANRVFARAEASCPRLLGPAPLVTEGVPGRWGRRYVNSDAVLTLKDGELILSHHRSNGRVLLGFEKEILAGQPVNACLAYEKLNQQGAE
jgi:hypothetical protein